MAGKSKLARGALEALTDITRRNFLKGAGATAATGALAGIKGLPKLFDKADVDAQAGDIIDVITDTIQGSMSRALNKEENWIGGDKFDPNWSFIDADVTMDPATEPIQKFLESPKLFMDFFDFVADGVHGATPESLNKMRSSVSNRSMRDLLDSTVDFSQVKKQRELEGSNSELMSEIARRAESKALKSLDHDFIYEIGDRVVTKDKIATAANPTPWEVLGKYIKDKGLLEESAPREGKFIKGPDVPYYKVRRIENAGTDKESEEIIHLPEWAITNNFGIKGVVE